MPTCHNKLMIKTILYHLKIWNWQITCQLSIRLLCITICHKRIYKNVWTKSREQWVTNKSSVHKYETFSLHVLIAYLAFYYCAELDNLKVVLKPQSSKILIFGRNTLYLLSSSCTSNSFILFKSWLYYCLINLFCRCGNLQEL